MAKTKVKTDEIKPGDVVCQKICKDAIIADFTNLKDWTGQYCTVCMKVVPGSYKKVVPMKNKEKLAPSAEYKQPEKKAKVSKESPKTSPEQSETKTEVKSSHNEHFLITEAFPTLAPDTLRLDFVTGDGESFSVELKSTEEKTAQLLKAKQSLIGRKALIGFLSLSDTGKPLNPVFKGLVK
jgi:hypothetical protein